MEFENAAQQETYEKVKSWMIDLFGDEFTFVDPDRPRFMLTKGSAAASIYVNAWGEDNATIWVRAWVVQKVELAPDLMHYLLLKNNEALFGAFGVDEEGDIFFEHTIAGVTCDREELRASVVAVLVSADEYDDQIVERWGGMSALDVSKAQ